MDGRRLHIFRSNMQTGRGFLFAPFLRDARVATYWGEDFSVLGQLPQGKRVALGLGLPKTHLSQHNAMLPIATRRAFHSIQKIKTLSHYFLNNKKRMVKRVREM